MKLAVLFSGGKDSTLALAKAMEKEQVACLITMISHNRESYMFHTPNIRITKMQAAAMGLPMVEMETEGKKEKELEDLKKAIEFARKKANIEGVVTGAIESVYQASRIQKICNDLKLFCFNPLWKTDQLKLMKEVIDRGFRIIVSGVYASPFDESWLGREIDNQSVLELAGMQEKFGISPSGEGGEIETTVLDAPFFRERVSILESDKSFKDYSGTFEIRKASLVKK